MNLPADKPLIRLSKNLPQTEALQLIPEVIARKYKAIPLAIYDNNLTVAMENPSDILALEALATQSQMRIEPVPASPEEIWDAIDFNYKAYDEIEKQISSVMLTDFGSKQSDIESKLAGIDSETVSKTPIVRALTLIIDEGVKARASDIHLQPQEHELRVRYRIDGTLHDMFSLPLETANPLRSRIKVLAGMNIADHHRPQDGQFSIITKGRLLDIRVGTTPTVYGEMVALRLLDKARATLSLSELGFSPDSLSIYEDMLGFPYGMILVSGPTGAGKTTTLYASINQFDSVSKNIITIEDPVEYRFNKINQIQVNPRAGITFAGGLRSILRLDPDIVLVGEIRDAETAQIAVQAALTGHVVLSSIHANDSTGAIMRLIDLGVEPFLVSSALVGVVAQRMVRKVCPDCGEMIEAPTSEQIAYSREVGEERSQYLYGKGCKSCSNTGYQGRTGIFEILRITDEMRMMLLKDTSGSALRTQSIKEGMVPLVRDGMLKVKAGITTPREVMRNAYSID